jgi:hypothetical protein
LPLSFRLPCQNPVCIYLLLKTCPMPYSFYPPRFHHPNNIQWGVQAMMLLTKQFSPASSDFLPSQHQISSSTHYSQTP